MKNRKQIEARRRQKTADRAKRNKSYAPPRAPKPVVKQDNPLERMKNIWFVLHGLNYLASDYANGTWEPVVDIYGDEIQINQIPSLQDVFVKVADKHFDGQTKTWTPKGKLLAAWLMVPPETMRGIRMALLGHLAQQVTVEAAADELVKPHNPAVWGFFNDQIISHLVQPDDTAQGETPAVVPDGEGTTHEHGETIPV